MKTVHAGGAEIPALGFGTYGIAEDAVTRIVEFVLSLGYRHLDTAQFYDNEQSIGDAVAGSSVPREQVFITTKVWPDRYRPGAFERSVAESLKKLRTDYIDLLLLHWPSRDVPLAETVGLLNTVHQQGMTRHIGLSNFTTTLSDEAVKLSDQPLVVNQVEYHPFLDQTPVLDALRRHNMALTAYSPLATGQVFKDATLQRIGQSHGKSAGQVGLRWLIQQDGVVAIPGSGNVEHATANFDIFDFELSDDQMRQISQLTKANRRLTDPEELSPEWD